MNAYFAGATAVALAATHWLAFQTGRDAELGVQARQDIAVARAAGAAASAAAEAISKIEVKHVTIRQELEREVRTREVFRDCRSGPDAVRLFNATAPGAGASAAGNRGLPATDAAR
jgi:hypothetical protein